VTRYVTDEGEGDCGQVASSLVLDAGGSLVLCHGYPVNTSTQYDGMKFWHAWTETPDGGFVIDHSNGQRVAVPREMYYAIGQIDELEVERYSWAETRTMLRTFRHYGPWDDAHPPVRDAESLNA
jgi:hypothetical protein